TATESTGMRSANETAPEIDFRQERLVGEKFLGSGHAGDVLLSRSGFIRALFAQVGQQRVDARMIALNCRAGSMQLEQTSNNLHRQNRHARIPLLANDSD